MNIPGIPTYRQALENMLTFMADMAKNHPDEAVRERISQLLADLMIAALVKTAEAMEGEENDR